MKHRISPRPVPRRDRDAEDYINRNRLNLLVFIDEWVLDSASRDGRSTYLPRKWLAEAYAILDAVRHVGPRRRAEIEAVTRITEDDRRTFRESWERVLGHPIGNEGGSDDRIGGHEAGAVPRMRFHGHREGMRPHPPGSEVLRRVPSMRLHRGGTRSRNGNRQVEQGVGRMTSDVGIFIRGYSEKKCTFIRGSAE